MKKSFLYCVIMLGACFSCTNGHKEEKELTSAEKWVRDSISRAEQKVKADSLKKNNPLLIMPPDSTYTGDYIDRYPNGIIKFRGLYRFGQKHGQWMSFFPNGELWSELHFDKGMRQGPNLTYFENGKRRYTGFYKNDKQDSIWTYYDSTGTVAEKVLYQRDVVIKRLPVR